MTMNEKSLLLHTQWQDKLETTSKMKLTAATAIASLVDDKALNEDHIFRKHLIPVLQILSAKQSKTTSENR